jgi:hypothetical protein
MVTRIALLIMLAVSLVAVSASPALGQKNFNVHAATYDPAKTNLVASQWVNGAGCPTLTNVAIYPATKPTGTYGDLACPTGDKDDHNDAGLLLVKTGPIANDAAGLGSIDGGVNNEVPTELGFDIRMDSHCGAGAPRFDLVTSDNMDHFIGGCANGTKTNGGSTEWMRVRFDPTNPSQAFPPVAAGVTIKSIQIVFDEPGQAIIDNIDINGVLVGKQ